MFLFVFLEFVSLYKKKEDDIMRNRKKAIMFRLSEEEYKFLSNKIKESGLTQQSYLLDSCLQGKVTSMEEINELKRHGDMLEHLDRQLVGMGTNLNQMAHISNINGDFQASSELVRISSEVQDIRKEVHDIWLLIRQSISRQRRTEL